MHEMSLCEGIRQVIEDQATQHNITQVKRVRVEIGRFAGVEKPALEFAFEVVMRGSVAEGAELIMLDLPGRAMCYDCAQEVEIDDRLAPCPKCGGGRLMPMGGDEMRIKDLEVN
ncbi:hydrogenase maturation nickel metallochaperone HypA [Epibacterium sp. SM1979]|uniref:Hydrogenase maturation factor HypA n=1 Tax=Tritonibacter litoralis TaxID=2662264 RepID=A0A843YD66_9RHOB|nr:hydrogenase maturation nickel metallochaperone HypA [Tritonibacter litoralis]MQQ07263.1 hydrogenase maturation nickel metallochaperone HypA [Tritonibacter litoralis]